MSDLRRQAADVVALYVVSKMSLRAIAARLGASHEAVRQLLIDEGVEIRERSVSIALAKAPTRGQPAPPAVREQSPTCEELERADRKHIRAVAQALGGKGFPFFAMSGAVA